MFPAIAPDDPRTKPLAYLTDSDRRHLYEVVDDGRGVIVLENCSTGFRMTVSRSAIGTYKLVRAAPDWVPNFAEG